MTGEVTLRGNVLPIGGLKEKSLAAHRSGISTVIIPKGNVKDLDDIPESVKESMEFVPVERVTQVLDVGALVRAEMQFQKAELADPRHRHSRSWPDTDLPEIVLAGRSNVGKSSFINAMCGRRKLAYVGNTPGKTRLLNFFNLDDRYMFVDVPGYGYANISKEQQLLTLRGNDGRVFQ